MAVRAVLVIASIFFSLSAWALPVGPALEPTTATAIEESQVANQESIEEDALTVASAYLYSLSPLLVPSVDPRSELARVSMIIAYGVERYFGVILTEANRELVTSDLMKAELSSLAARGSGDLQLAPSLKIPLAVEAVPNELSNRLPMVSLVVAVFATIGSVLVAEYARARIEQPKRKRRRRRSRRASMTAERSLAYFGLTNHASLRELHRAYRRRARVLHPDIAHGDGHAFIEMVEHYERAKAVLGRKAA